MRYSFFMEKLQHDNHQFFFERYLRNKLPSSERAELEESLKKDPDLRDAFEKYKLNRKVFLKELISEHDKGPKKSRLLNLFYLVLTVIGMATAFNFYLENRLLKEQREVDKNLISRLVDKLPFVGKRFKSDTAQFNANLKSKSGSVKGIDTPTNREKQQTIPKLEEQLLSDTVLIPLLRSYYDEKYAYFKSEVDSTLSAKEIQQLVFKNQQQYDLKYKSRAVGIEIWQSSQAMYQFDGIKLKIYGPALTTQLLLVNDQGELIWLNGDQEILLLTDNQPHEY